MNPVVFFASKLIDLYIWAIIIWAVVGLLVYFNVMNRFHPLIRMVDDVARKIIEPVLNRIRRVIGNTGGLDLSPIILIVALQSLNYALWYYSR